MPAGSSPRTRYSLTVKRTGPAGVTPPLRKAAAPRVLSQPKVCANCSSFSTPFWIDRRTVTCLRSPSTALFEVRIFSARRLGIYVWGELNRGSPGLAVAVSDLPQPPQNFSPPSFRKPHEAHVEANDSPHSPQKRRPSRFSARQRGQFTLHQRHESSSRRALASCRSRVSNPSVNQP